jgi:hypothetical protein
LKKEIKVAKWGTPKKYLKKVVSYPQFQASRALTAEQLFIQELEQLPGAGQLPPEVCQGGQQLQADVQAADSEGGIHGSVFHIDIAELNLGRSGKD